MTYEPITEEKKEEFIAWLEEHAAHLNGKKQCPVQREIFQTEEGDIATSKDLVGNLLATLSNKPVTIF